MSLKKIIASTWQPSEITIQLSSNKVRISIIGIVHGPHISMVSDDYKKAVSERLPTDQSEPIFIEKEFRPYSSIGIQLQIKTNFSNIGIPNQRPRFKVAEDLDSNAQIILNSTHLWKEKKKHPEYKDFAQAVVGKVCQHLQNTHIFRDGPPSKASILCGIIHQEDIAKAFLEKNLVYTSSPEQHVPGSNSKVPSKNSGLFVGKRVAAFEQMKNLLQQPGSAVRQGQPPKPWHRAEE